MAPDHAHRIRLAVGYKSKPLPTEGIAAECIDCGWRNFLPDECLLDDLIEGHPPG